MRQQLPLVLGEQPEDAELVRRQMDALAVDVDRPLLEIDADRADLDHRLARRRSPPQRRTQAREQLSDRERLRDVVVGARVEGGDLLVLVADGRHDDDRRFAPRRGAPGTPRCRVPSGQQQVEDDRVGRLRRRRAERLAAVVAVSTS